VLPGTKLAVAAHLCQANTVAEEIHDWKFFDRSEALRKKYNEIANRSRKRCKERRRRDRLSAA
jgi:hypothetical protein